MGVQDSEFQQLKDRALLYKLVHRLSRLCQGMSRELDSQLGLLRTQLDNNVAISSLEQRLKQLDSLLKSQLTYRDEHSLELLNSIGKFGEYLQKTKGLEPKLRRDLRAFMQAEEPYGSFRNQERLFKLFDFYHQALVHNNKASAEASASSPTLDEVNQQLICDELQQIIAELEVSKDIAAQLAKIRHTLLQGVLLDELPPLCLTVIKLIIEGTQRERNSSKEFLTSLNESLNIFHTSFSQTVVDSKEVSCLHQTLEQTLKEGIDKLNQEVASSKPLKELKQSISLHLSDMATYISEKEALYQRENQLIDQLNMMGQQLSTMKDESDTYKKRLSVQQAKLYIDALTQVHNRAALDERMEQEYKRWKRYKHSLSIIVIDIDDFKSINDTYGHMAGDKALKVIAMAMQKLLRETDFLARFGGEEFVLLMPNIDGDNIEKPLNNLRNKIKKIPFKFKHSAVSITISLGASFFKEGDGHQDAFERADNALYEAKNNGKDQVCIKL